MIGRSNAGGGDTISLKNRIAELEEQLRNSFTADDLLNGLSVHDRKYTATNSGIFIADARRSITNHDNSSEGYISANVKVNGAVVATKEERFREWSGASVAVNYKGKMSAGDVIEIEFGLRYTALEGADVYFNDSARIVAVAK